MFSETTHEFLFEGKEISVVYYRSGYSPGDYTSEDDWDVRLRIELSRSIKCPNIAYHLTGTKKVQQILTEPNQLERFLSSSDCALIRQSFAGLYSLGDVSESEIIEKVVKNS